MNKSGVRNELAVANSRKENVLNALKICLLG